MSPWAPPVISLFLVWLTGAMEIRVPDFPIIGRFGHDVSLGCAFTPESNFSLEELSVIWQVTDTKGPVVHSFSEGQDKLTDQGPNFANRTALFYEELPRGNVSLLLRQVQIADEGSFTCFVRVKNFSIAAVSLEVAASYTKPSLYLEPAKNLKPGDTVKVTCHTFHGYPEATVLWRDGLGNNITENVSISQVANEEGLFDVRSILWVTLEPNSTYNCLVRNPVLQEETHSSVTITGQHLSFPAVALWVTVGLAICLLILLGALAYVCRRKVLQVCTEDAEFTGTEGEEEGEELKTATQPLKESNSKADHPQQIE